MFHGAEHEEPEEYADQTITDNGSAGSWAKVLKDSFVKGEADLIPAICDAWSAEVHPRRNRSAGTEDQPKATDGVHVGKEVDQSDQTHQSADGGAAKTQNSFLIAGTDR